MSPLLSPIWSCNVVPETSKEFMLCFAFLRESGRKGWKDELEQERKIIKNEEVESVFAGTG